MVTEANRRSSSVRPARPFHRLRRLAWIAVTAVLTCAPVTAEKPDFRVFGSLGNETHLTPGNPSSRLNPGDFLRVPAVSNSLDFNLFADLVPEDKAWKLHLKLRGANDWNRDDTVSKIEVGELNFGVSLTSWLDVQAGRSIEKWGTGYAWNPTGVVNPRKNPSDPNDRRGLYRGVDNVKVDLFIRDWNVTLLAAPEIDWKGQQQVTNLSARLGASDSPAAARKHLLATGWAVRAYRLIQGVDFSLSASGGNGLPNSQGVSVSRVVGKALELHAEAAAFQDSVRFRPVDGGWKAETRRHVDLLFGGQYTFPRSVNLVLEYYHSGNGLDDREWRNYQDMVIAAGQDLAQGNPTPLLLDNLYYSVLTMARDYGFARLYWLFHHDTLEAEVLALANLRDGSSLLRPGLYWRIHPNWSLYWLQGELLGGVDTEFGHLQVSRVSDFGVRFHF
ncbi:MAG: hypothetical protein ACE15E_14930 [Acidobacteriota bacterium]